MSRASLFKNKALVAVVAVGIAFSAAAVIFSAQMMAMAQEAFEGAVSAEHDTVADGFVFSDAGDKHYRTVLLASGKLEDLADPLCYPDGFKNEGIQSMSNTADATTTLAVVRSADGSATCFDYTAGEVKFQKQSSGEDQSLGEYAKDFFGGLFSSADDAAKTGDRGYASALELENKAGRGAVTTGGRVAIFTSAVLAIGAILLML